MEAGLKEKVQLGFVERPDKAGALQDFAYLPDKVGGKPTWLVPHGVPSASELACARCDRPMSLLLQIYAPFSELSHAHHRMVYLFCCSSGSCHASLPMGSFKVFRCQLPQENPYYVEETCDGNEPTYRYHMPEKVFFCAVCGIRAEKRCGACRLVHYCTAFHQKEHWRRGHKEECPKIKALGSQPKTTAEKPSLLLFDEWEIITEEEPSSEEESEEEDYVKKLSKRYSELTQINRKVNVKELADMPEDQIDESFINFQRRVKRSPEQVLRYSRWPGAQPLWVEDKAQPTEQDFPPCPQCNAPRRFEFQVLPQLLHYLGVENAESDGTEKAINWGTVAIYSCPNACHPRTTDAPNLCPNYFEECVWSQYLE